ncbi:hypothetical protein Mapa_005165 [Marchantia paleacea]|nr:hypothetical protein Mapa_005165 [Marchantia paleacea]
MAHVQTSTSASRTCGRCFCHQNGCRTRSSQRDLDFLSWNGTRNSFVSENCVHQSVSPCVYVCRFLKSMSQM